MTSDDRLDPIDRALAELVSRPADATELLTLEQLAERTGVSIVLLEAIEREGFLAPVGQGADRRYTSADVATVEAGLALLDAGLPLGELLDLARRFDEAARGVADRAVDLFVRFVRDPVHGTAASREEATARLVAAFEEMLPAAGTVVAHHFRRLLLDRARARVEDTSP
ncbi:MAG: hypothetical protein KY462_03505 [Actinobacteria bacterium]|nr:hypothetical protein [Actinomycetota bacterium]